MMTSEEKILGAVALGGLAILLATRGSAKANGGLEGSGAQAYDPCAHLANVRAQHAALMATGQQKAAQGMLPIIISLEEQCEAKPKSKYAEKMAKAFGDRGDPKICLRWETSGDKISWGAPQFSKIEDAVETAAEKRFHDFGSMDEAHEIAFMVARDALKSVCPHVPVPALLEQVDEYKDNPDLGPWWDQLWDYFWSAAWAKVVAMGGGSL